MHPAYAMTGSAGLLLRLVFVRPVVVVIPLAIEVAMRRQIRFVICTAGPLQHFDNIVIFRRTAA
jgi:hypothetical protein